MTKAYSVRSSPTTLDKNLVALSSAVSSDESTVGMSVVATANIVITVLVKNNRKAVKKQFSSCFFPN